MVGAAVLAAHVKCSIEHRIYWDGICLECLVATLLIQRVSLAMQINSDRLKRRAFVTLF
jgi:hypothetical protein